MHCFWHLTSRYPVIGRCCTAPDNWKCTTAVPLGGCAASGSPLSPVLSWCVNPSRIHPTSTCQWTAEPSSADTAWTWSSPTVTRGKSSEVHTASSWFIHIHTGRIHFWPCGQSEVMHLVLSLLHTACSDLQTLMWTGLQHSGISTSVKQSG